MMANSTKISEYSTTAANNTSIDSIDIDENCAASGINNAIRSVLKHQADAFTQGTPIALDQTNNNVGIGTTTIEDFGGGHSTLEVAGTTTSEGGVFKTATSDSAGTGTTGTEMIMFTDSTNGGSINVVSSDALRLMTANTARMTIDSSGVVGIGLVPSGTEKLQVSGQIKASQDGSASAPAFVINDGDTGFYRPSNNTMGFTTAGSERMRMLSDGQILMARTATSGVVAGHRFDSNGFTQHVRSGGQVMELSRQSNDGDIQTFKDGTTVIGSIGGNGNDRLYIVSGDTGLDFERNTDAIRPCSGSGGGRDDVIDLGRPDVRFDDIYATNGSIQTSDQNEKNTIADSDLGLDFINRLSPKSYIYNGKTRTHYGLIAQDVETVLGDISKPASEFAGFIKSDISDEQDGSEHKYGLRYTEFISPLIQAVKDLKTQLDAEKAKVSTLETEMTALKARVTALEA